jgi:hypothetical protein
MQPDVLAIGPPGVVTVPPDVDLRAAVEAADPDDPPVDAVVALRPGAALALRHAARPGPLPDTVVLTDRDIGRIADRVVEWGADARPVDSPELAAELRKRLSGTLDAHPAPVP